MKKLLIAILVCLPLTGKTQDLSKVFKFATFYAAANGGTSLSDNQTWSVTSGTLQEEVVETPFDYSISLGIRKIKRFGYENRANTFYNGTENSYSDAATIGRLDGFEYLFETNLERRLGNKYNNQNHFIRYVADTWIAKLAYVEDGFADIKYFEASQRYRYQINNKLSLNIGAVQRLAQPYGFDPLEDWILDNGTMHYTYLALQEGYTITLDKEYFNPSGDLVASSQPVWEEVVIPQVIADYVEKERDALSSIVEYSIVLGADYYHYTKQFWFHSWANVMPYHIDTDNEYSYHKYNDDKQWIDFSVGMICGYKFNKSLGTFVEGKYNKYWNRKWHDFSVGINYVIF